MEHLPFLMTFAGFVAPVLVVLVFFRRIGRLKTGRDLAMSASLVVVVGAVLAHLEVKADEAAKASVARLFRLDADRGFVAFNRHGSKGTRTGVIEAIYKFSPEDFDAYRRQPLGPVGGLSFKYRTGNETYRAIDGFNPSGGALAWAPLPRTYPGKDGFYPRRGHYSQQRTPDESAMSGEFLCAFIPVALGAPEPPAGDQAIPCSAVAEPDPEGISILAILNRQDHTLHVRIE